jgi:hypothetical protein
MAGIFRPAWSQKTRQNIQVPSLGPWHLTSEHNLMFGRRNNSKGPSNVGMNRQVQIELNHSNGIYAPGEELVATVSWGHETSVRSLHLRLVWSTQGKGDTDTGSLAETSIEEAPPRGPYVWRVVLPRGPLTLHGQILSIEWSVGCEIDFDDKSESHEVPFQLSYGEQPIQLSKVLPP